jgi:hypothetical protein
MGSKLATAIRMRQADLPVMTGGFPTTRALGGVCAPPHAPGTRWLRPGSDVLVGPTWSLTFDVDVVVDHVGVNDHVHDHVGVNVNDHVHVKGRQRLDESR